MKVKLKKLLQKMNLNATEKQLDQLILLVDMIHKWNKAYNLTSVRDPEQMLIKHIVDSLAVNIHLKSDSIIDVGTGPGLPGLPLAILNPDKNFTLLDSLGKRISFIRQVVHELGLKNVNPVKSRVEDFNPEKKYAIVLSRAFASLSDMVQWCDHLVAPDNGRFLALKGAVHQDEIDLLAKDYVVENIYRLKVPNLNAERHLIEIKKTT